MRAISALSNDLNQNNEVWMYVKSGKSVPTVSPDHIRNKKTPRVIRYGVDFYCTVCPARTGHLDDLTAEAVCAAFCHANETELLKSFTALADYHEAKNYLEVPF